MVTLPSGAMIRLEEIIMVTFIMVDKKKKPFVFLRGVSAAVELHPCDYGDILNRLDWKNPTKEQQ